MARPVQLGIACLNSVKVLYLLNAKFSDEGLAFRQEGKIDLYIKPVVFDIF